MSINIFRLPGAPVACGKKLQLQLRDSAGIPPASLLATCKKSAYNMKNYFDFIIGTGYYSVNNDC